MPDGAYFTGSVADASGGQSTAAGVDDTIRVSIARGADDVQRCMVIRAIVFLAEAGASYDEHYGENDYSGTHLLVWKGREPVGTLRLRWLAGEARFERLAVRPDHRSLPVLRRLIAFAMELIAAKGYARASGLTRQKALGFWRRRGATVCGGPVVYHGEPLVPIRIRLPAAAHPALAAGPGAPEFEAMLLRPETALLERRG